MSDFVVKEAEDGRFEVRWSDQYGGGWACFHSFETSAEAEAWIAGYETGTRENM